MNETKEVLRYMRVRDEQKEIIAVGRGFAVGYIEKARR